MNGTIVIKVYRWYQFNEEKCSPPPQNSHFFTLKNNRFCYRIFRCFRRKLCRWNLIFISLRCRKNTTVEKNTIIGLCVIIFLRSGYMGRGWEGSNIHRMGENMFLPFQFKQCSSIACLYLSYLNKIFWSGGWVTFCPCPDVHAS